MLFGRNTEGMTLDLSEMSAAVAPWAHTVLALNQVWLHELGALVVPANVTLMPLPPDAASSTRSRTSGSSWRRLAAEPRLQILR